MIKNQHFGVCLLLAVLCLAVGCQDAGPQRVIVLHTGRMMGNVYPDQMRGLAPLQHYPRLAGYVAAVRREAEQNGDIVLLLDGGDSFLGSFSSFATGGENMRRLFSELGYDAIFLGNLDADIDPAALDGLGIPVLTPFVSASSEVPYEGLQTSAVLKKNGLRIGLLPNFHGDLALDAAPQRFPMWFGPGNDRVKPLRDYKGKIPQDVDLLLFNWMKFEPAEQDPSGFLSVLRDLGVHAVTAHRIDYSPAARQPKTEDSAWPLPVSANILRNNAGFTVARMELVRDGRGWRVAEPPVLVHLTDDAAAPDPQIAALMADLAPRIQAADLPLEELTEMVGKDELMQACLAVFARIPGADFVLYSPNSIRAPLDAGPLGAGRLFNSLPWTSPLYRVRLEAGEWGRIQTMADYVVRSRADAAASGTLVTSRYFARILQNELDLPDDRLQPVSNDSEFETFVRAVANGQVDLENPRLPEGWLP